MTRGLLILIMLLTIFVLPPLFQSIFQSFNQTEDSNQYIIKISDDD